MMDTEEYIKQLEQEIKERNKQKQIKAYEELMAKLAKEQEEREKIPPQNKPGYAINKFVEEKHARGEIVDVFIQKYLDGKITTARWTLALAMAATFLFKRQWIYWIVFIVIYKIYVTVERKKAFEEDKRRHNKK